MHCFHCFLVGVILYQSVYRRLPHTCCSMENTRAYGGVRIPLSSILARAQISTFFFSHNILVNKEQGTPSFGPKGKVKRIEG